MTVWTVKGIVEHATSVQTEHNGRWVPARPLPGPFLWRVRAAWLVLIGRADAVVWSPDAP